MTESDNIRSENLEKYIQERKERILSVGEARKGHLDFLYYQYTKGYELSETQIKLLERYDYFKGDEVRVENREEKKDVEIKYRRPLYKVNTKANAEFLRQRYGDRLNYDDWRPKSTLDHTPEFINWINSMLFGAFTDMTVYTPYLFYKNQATLWMDDKLSVDASEQEIEDFRMREIDRCRRNTLYFANKYGTLTDSGVGGGFTKYIAMEHHSVLFFMLDCGYNFMLGKGRQIGSSTALGIGALAKISFNSNFFLKFIAEDGATVAEIFRDKIKEPFGKLPIFMRAHVESFAEEKFALGKKDKKTGKYGYPNSRIEVVPPSPTAINGGSPDLVFVDEIGQIPVLSEMINEGRPTMYGYNDKGELVLKRQIVCWGTGSKTTKGRGAYEKEWYRMLNLWNNRETQTGLIPLFFSWHTRCDNNFYEDQKAYYYGSRMKEKDIDLETSKIQFHQHYPTTYRDMFLTTTSTLVSKSIIQGGITKCRELKHNLRPVFGRFEPVYDYTKPETENSDLPYKVIDSKFIPIDEEDDYNKITTLMFLSPEKWENRYYQGTDPIESETGHSKMSSIIWDDYYKSPVCLVNFRKQYAHKESFLQCMLMGIYYDKIRPVGKKRGVPELIESNIGTAYKDYKESKGYFRSFVMNTELPRDLQGGAKMVGIDNHSTRSGLIISKMSECIKNYNERMYFMEIFQQLDSFVMKITSSGKESWERNNKATDYDDVLFALVYSYICSTLYTKEPKNIEEVSEEVNSKSKIRYKIKRDKDYNIIREAVRV